MDGKQVCGRQFLRSSHGRRFLFFWEIVWYLFCSKEIVLIEFFYIPFLYQNFIVKLTSVLVAVLLNLFCPILGSLYVYEQGFVFVHPRFGVISLPISKFSRVQFYDKVTIFQKSIFLTGNPFYQLKCYARFLTVSTEGSHTRAVLDALNAVTLLSGQVCIGNVLL